MQHAGMMHGVLTQNGAQIRGVMSGGVPLQGPTMQEVDPAVAAQTHRKKNPAKVTKTPPMIEKWMITIPIPLSHVVRTKNPLLQMNHDVKIITNTQHSSAAKRIIPGSTPIMTSSRLHNRLGKK